MRHLILMLLITIFLIVPTFATADDWDKYMLSMDRFYNLDKQDFKSISCNIEVPLTKNQVKQLHTQFDPIKDKIELKENLADFSVTYTKNSGLNFNRPSLDIKIISEKGMSDSATVKKGVELVNAAFKQQVEGAIMQLQGLFDEFETPKKSQHKIKEIKSDKTTYTAIYDKDGSNFTEIYSNNQRKIKQISKNGDEISSTENYKNIAANKLLLTDAQANIKNAMGNIEMNMTISYEKIKDVLFPAHIDVRFKQSVQTIKQEGQVDIYLKDCILQEEKPVATQPSPVPPPHITEVPHPKPVAAAPPAASTTELDVEARARARDQLEARRRAANERELEAKRQLKAKQSECVYKPVMTDEDRAKCGIGP